MQIRQVALADIEQPDPSELKQSRLDMLLNGAESFDAVLNSTSDPITLQGAHPPYEILDGRHRVYLARQQGCTHIPAHLEHGTNPSASVSKERRQVAQANFVYATSDDIDITKEAKDLFKWFFNWYIVIIAAIISLPLCGLLVFLGILGSMAR